MATRMAGGEIGQVIGSRARPYLGGRIGRRALDDDDEEEERADERGRVGWAGRIEQ